MATIDEDLGQIEKDIRRLKIEYEQFFGGGRPRPPADTQWRLESLMRRYNERTAELSFGQRFRFTNLTQTYAKYVDMWRKKTMQKEGGASQHHFGAAAKAIEASRAREAQPAGAERSGPEQAGADRDVRVGDSGGPGTRRGGLVCAIILEPGERKNEDRAALPEAHRGSQQSGESAAAPNLQAFERFVRKKTQELKDKGGSEVEYSVTIQDGRVKLKARISA